MSRLTRGVIAGIGGLLLLLHSLGASAGPGFIAGRIDNVTFVDDYVMIRVDAGLPDNCVGTAWGWMKIPPTSKAMIAFVAGLWMRGDAASTFVTVYTEGLEAGYCRVSQIDPEG